MSLAPRAGARGPSDGPTARETARGARVVWTDISVASREKRPELERFLKQVVGEQTRRAHWGARRDDPIEARLEVTEFSVVVSQDVARVTCTGVGHLKNGQSVRSHFSMGGRPAQRAALEHQLLTMLGRGIVNRLAEIARGRHS
jgi:hypothetical protein